MTRKQALATIRVEVALYGKHTKESMRAYIETRNVGRAAFNEAGALGLAQYQAAAAKYRAGQYTCDPPDVCHANWEEADWIAHIRATGGFTA